MNILAYTRKNDDDDDNITMMVKKKKKNYNKNKLYRTRNVRREAFKLAQLRHRPTRM